MRAYALGVRNGVSSKHVQRQPLTLARPMSLASAVAAVLALPLLTFNPKRTDQWAPGTTSAQAKLGGVSDKLSNCPENLKLFQE